MSRIFALKSSLVLLLSLAIAGCKGTAGTEKAGPAGSATPGGGDCAAYSKFVCDKAGADSQHCMAMRDLEPILPPKACAAAVSEQPFTELKIATEMKPCTDIVERLCKDIGPDTESCKMVRVRTPSFPPAQCVKMTEQYASVLAELRKVEDKKKPLDAAKQATLVDGAKATFGPKDAKVKVVIFSDFQCPYCAMATKSLDVVRHNFADKVYLVFRQFPLTQIHAQAELAAEASLAAADQGKFWEFHDKVFANQSALDQKSLEAYAKDVGLDMSRFRAALEKHTFKAVVDADRALGGTANVEATPTLFLNGKIIDNAGDAPALVAAIDNELKH